MARDWSSLSKSTQQQILDLRAKGLGNLSQTFETPHFVLHYTTIGNHSVPTLDANKNRIPDFIDVAARSLEAVWQREIVELRYPPPVGTPAQKFHVYYKDLTTYYGATYPENVTVQATSPVPLGTASAYIVVENDFYDGFPPNDEDVTGAETVRSGALKVTQAHEFMHAIQFNMNVLQSGWLMESHATWAEDAVYDGVNDWHWYINRFLATPDLPLFSRFLYGAAYFQNWLSETYGADIQRQIWLAAKTNTMRDAIRLDRLRRHVGAAEELCRRRVHAWHQRLHVGRTDGHSATDERHRGDAQRLPGQRVDRPGHEEGRQWRAVGVRRSELRRVLAGRYRNAHPHVRRCRWLRVACTRHRDAEDRRDADRLSDFARRVECWFDLDRQLRHEVVEDHARAGDRGNGGVGGDVLVRCDGELGPFVIPSAGPARRT